MNKVFLVLGSGSSVRELYCACAHKLSHTRTATQYTQALERFNALFIIPVLQVSSSISLHSLHLLHSLPSPHSRCSHNQRPSPAKTHLTWKTSAWFPLIGLVLFTGTTTPPDTCHTHPAVQVFWTLNSIICGGIFFQGTVTTHARVCEYARMRGCVSGERSVRASGWGRWMGYGGWVGRGNRIAVGVATSCSWRERCCPYPQPLPTPLSTHLHLIPVQNSTISHSCKLTASLSVGPEIKGNHFRC